MQRSSAHITSRLLQQHLQGELTLEGHEQLAKWLQDDPLNRQLFEQLNDGVSLQTLLSGYHVRRRIMDQQLSVQLPELMLELEDEQASKNIVHRLPIFKIAWIRYAAAISILFGIGAYLWNIQNDSRTITQTQPVVQEKDILPGGQKAMLTLADGRTIVLDSAANGQLAVENGSEVIKKDGQIIYGARPFNNIKVSFNTMSTPKGGQYQLTLADGTKVWLNAASKIIYPTIFNGSVREVKTEGEVYFEVAKNKSKPFIVKSGKDEVTVLGTSFNINNYSDEPMRKISLINGAVKVNDKLLQPRQAYVEGKIIITNIEQDVAWKNGAFNFDGADLPAVLRQLERWYDIIVKYEGAAKPGKFKGKLHRDLTLLQIVEALKETGVQFRLEGKTLFVK